MVHFIMAHQTKNGKGQFISAKGSKGRETLYKRHTLLPDENDDENLKESSNVTCLVYSDLDNHHPMHIFLPPLKWFENRNSAHLS